ncbi:ABC transporter ATP-binding protein [Halorientalis marina]|jgi:ABC-type multidrug transport system ATPase subunit|uniref:ABC transporter ATP-binding protein n=1 Tax=Halorientalis marina TaxID=2931976 RepID=UPI001FF4B967|nr:ABC transporter ATP-binding protein [Halorientalis marina]
MTEHVATLDSVTVSFGDLTVVEDASFAVESDAVTCLIGPNGSGKTTLLRAVTGLLALDRGHVDRTVSTDRPVGYLAQEPTFRPQFTVRETLEFYADLIGHDIDVPAVIDRVGLGGVPDRRVEALSGGMTRLLGIAQATLGDPGLLVLDEPSSGLDPMMTRHITETVSELADGETGVLLATHDLASVERVGDEVVVLDRGQVVETGTPTALLDETDTGSLDEALSALVSGESGSVATREVVSAEGGDGGDR